MNRWRARHRPADPPRSTSPTERVRRMFASIARRYDLLNHLLSLNIDRSWRTFTTRVAAPEPGVPVLDCCTGTADLALAYDRAGRGQSPIVGTDFCREMLVLGHAKVNKARAAGRVTLVEGDAQRLPLPSDTFGVVSVAFGLRNVRDTVRGIDEMIRVARPGGKVAILEFSRPRGRFLGRLYLAFFRHLLPRIGQALAPNAGPGLRLSAPERPGISRWPGDARPPGPRGLTELRHYPLTGGIATLYVGTKPVPLSITRTRRSRSDDSLRFLRPRRPGGGDDRRQRRAVRRAAVAGALPGGPDDPPFDQSQRRPGAREGDGPGSRPRSVRSLGLRRSRGRPACLSSLPGFHRGDCQRLVPDRRDDHHPVQHEHAGLHRQRSVPPT